MKKRNQVRKVTMEKEERKENLKKRKMKGLQNKKRKGTAKK